MNGWNLQITHLERKMIFQASMIMFHVNLPGCKHAKKRKKKTMILLMVQKSQTTTWDVKKTPVNNRNIYHHIDWWSPDFWTIHQLRMNPSSQRRQRIRHTLGRIIQNRCPLGPLLGGFNPLYSQIGSFPQVGVKIKNIWNLHLGAIGSICGIFLTFISWFSF